MKSETRARDIFYGVVAVATLIVAIVGATLAYFSISVSSNEGAVNAMSANVSISYDDGQQVTAQADKLIPATLSVVQSVYETKITELGPDSPNELNACIDDNNQEVCSAYRFTVGSNVERTISATLNNEENGFTYLSYAVYDVNNGVWLELNDEGAKSLGLTKCSNENADETDNCHSTGENNIKTYSTTPKAVNSIFGITADGATTKYKTQPLTADATRTFDLVLFINENNANQNVDQGKHYRGTIIVDVNDGTTAGQISGFVNTVNNG